MAKKLSDFIKSLIVKAGGNVEDEKIKTALASVDANIELQDELATAIDHGLISIANAKNNHPEIKNHYYASAYNGLDAELDGLIEEEKLPEEAVTEIKAEKSSTKRAVLLAKKIKQLESAKSGQGKAETKALNEQIAALNAELKKEKDGINGIKAEYEKKLREKDKGYAMRNLLGQYNTIHDKLDPDTKNIIINAIIDKNLRTKGYVLDLDDNGNLIVATKDGSGIAFADDHTPLTPKRFLDKMMADENLILVSDNQNNQNQNQNNRNNNQNNNNSGGFNNRNNNNSGGFNRNNNQNNNQNNDNNNSGQKSTVLKDLLKRAQDDLNNASRNSVI